MKSYKNSSDEEDYSSDEGNVSDEEVRCMHAISNQRYFMHLKILNSNSPCFLAGIGGTAGHRKGKEAG